jgi:hypothetical protein
LVKRSVNSPWGNVYKEGLPSTAVDDKTLVDQEVRPTINTGSIDVRTGKWEGVTHSDENFKDFTTHLAIPNGAAVLAPATATRDYIDMTGFSDLFFAIKPSNGGNFAIEAVMGPDTNTFANLTPVDPAVTIKTSVSPNTTLSSAFYDSAETLTADVWNIYNIQTVLSNQKNLQFKILNNSGGESNIEFAYLRMV